MTSSVHPRVSDLVGCAGELVVAITEAARAMLHEADAMVCLKVPARFDAGVTRKEAWNNVSTFSSLHNKALLFLVYGKEELLSSLISCG
jgi:hypothetical protein